MQQQMQQQNMGMQQNQMMMNNDIRRVQQGYAQQPMGYGNQGGYGHGGSHGGKMKKMKKGCHGGKKHKGYKIKLF